MVACNGNMPAEFKVNRHWESSTECCSTYMQHTQCFSENEIDLKYMINFNFDRKWNLIEHKRIKNIFFLFIH